MRKIYKISALLFIVAVLIGAALSVSPVVYAADNYYELYENEGDQTPFYVSTSKNLVISVSGKTASYVKLLKDVTQTEQITIKKDLTIDLGTHKLTQPSGGKKIEVGAYTEKPVDITLTIKNGIFESSYSQAIQPRLGTKIIFENASVQYKSTKGEMFYGAQGRSVTLINSTLSAASGVVIVGNSATTETGYLDKEGMQFNLINSFILEEKAAKPDSEAAQKATPPILQSSKGSEGVCRIHVNLIGNSGINIRLFNPECTLKPDRVIRASKGAYLNVNDELPTVGIDGYSIEFYRSIEYNEETNSYLPGKALLNPLFSEADEEDFLYMVYEKLVKVNWVYMGSSEDDKNPGEVEKTEIWEDIPDGSRLNYIPQQRECYKASDGLIYFSRFLGWSLSSGADEPEQIKCYGDQNTFYAVYEECVAPYLHYDGEGNLKKYYTDNSINLDIFDTFLDGDLIVAQASIYYQDTRPIDGLNSFKFDLNGHSLSLISLENDISLYAPNSGKTAVFVNGTIHSEGVQAIKCGFAGRNGSDGKGKILLENVLIKSCGRHAIELCGGSLELNGGAIKSYDTSSAVVLVDGNEATLSVKNASIILDDGRGGNAVITLECEPGAFFNHTVTLEGVTVNGAALLKSEGAANASSSLTLNVFDSELNISDSVFSVAKDAGFKLTVNYKNSVSDSDPRVGIGSGSFNLAEGMTLVEYMDKFIAVEADTTLDVNMTLTDSFAINFYLPLDTDVELLTVDGRVIFDMNSPGESKQVSVNGQQVDRYIATYEGVRPNNAAKSLSLSMRITSGGERYYYETTYSVLDYVESVITSTGTPEAEREFGRAILAYIKAAYEYFNETSRASDDELARLNTLANKYAPTERAVPTVAGADKTAAKVYVSSVQYRLRESVSLVINLTEAGQNARVSVKIDGTEVLSLAENHGKSTAEIKIAATDLSRTVNVTVGTASFDYTLCEYVKSVENTENAALSKMLRALYVYSAAAVW